MPGQVLADPQLLGVPSVFRALACAGSVAEIEPTIGVGVTQVVAVGGTGVLVGVLVGVSVGVLVGGTGVLVGVFVGGSGVLVGVWVGTATVLVGVLWGSGSGHSPSLSLLNVLASSSIISRSSLQRAELTSLRTSASVIGKSISG